MSQKKLLTNLMHQTIESLKTDLEHGIESLYLPDGLDSVISLPRKGEYLDSNIKATSLSQLYDKYCRCEACSLGHKRKNFVFGAGKENAKVMFVGEAPGASEDEQGEPFVGAAGKLLTRILGAINFSRDDVYITNILKCRPPNNRDPLPEEVQACDTILKEQIHLVQPRLICALGRVAAQALLKTKSSIRDLRGQFHDYQKMKLLVTYHPSGLLRNPAYKRPTWEDMQMLRREYDRIENSGFT